MKISYNWLKWYVPELPAADALADVFTYHLAEVESVENVGDDTVYDINVLPNRAHDLLSHMGVGREIAGQLGLAYNDPTPAYKIPTSVPTKLAVELATPHARRYMARIVRGVKVGPSPEWVVKHLESIGQRSINNVVDATNIVLFDSGQPTHAFDVSKLSSEKITIRMAADGETMTTLDKKDLVLKASDMVIADGSGVLALAGVKGGTKAEVDDATTDILLEVANFEPSTVRKTARRLGIFTDAAKRFENDLSPELAPYAMRELCGLLLEYFPEATFEDVVDVYPNPQPSRELVFAASEIEKLLGAETSAEEIQKILERYQYSFSREGEVFKLSVPALRLDLTGSHDMAEEIGRILGYDRVVPVIPHIEFAPKKNEQHARMLAAREKLLADGYSEILTYTFSKKGAVEVARGAKGKEFLRTNLSDGLKAAYEMNRLNAPLLGVDHVKIFEIGTVFVSLDAQETRVAYADNKGVVESTLEEFTRDLSLDAVPTSSVPSNAKFAPWSQYPFISRDISLWIPDTDEARGELVFGIFKKLDRGLLQHIFMFDSFKKEGKNSLGFRLVFQAFDRTLTDQEVSLCMKNMAEAIAQKGWEIR